MASPESLDLLHRILVITDGTLTDVLQAAFEEPILLVRLDVSVTETETPIATLDLAAGATLMERKILLRGERSQRSYVYAESLLAVDHLEPSFREELLKSDSPLGRLWLEHRLETWKERCQVSSQQAGELAVHFGVQADTQLLVRQYRVFNGGRPIILITEYFPDRY